VGDQLIATLTGVIGSHEDVVVAYLFGRAARGKLRPASDVDVAILLASGTTEPAFVDLSSLRLGLQADLQRRPIARSIL